MKTLPKRFQLFFFLITLSATIILAWTVYSTEWNKDAVVNLLVFGILAVLCESMPVALPKGGYVTVSVAVFLSAAVLFPLGITLSIVTLGGLLVFGKDVANAPFYKRVFNASQFMLSVTFAHSIFGLINNKIFSFTLSGILIYIAMAFIYMFTNLTIVTLALGMMQKKSPAAMWVSNMKWILPNFLALAPLGLLLALIYNNFSVWGLFLLFIPLLLSRHSFQLYVNLRENYLNTVEALVQALEAKDTYTSGHSSRVGKLVASMAEEMKMSDEKIVFLKYASVLHDVGKIGVSEFILNKKEKLLDSEWEAIRNHPVIGEEIIQKIKFMYDIGHVTRHHHERYDGHGYPDGLRGEQIPLESRIIAVADTYDAMTSDRSYRNARTHEEAIAELRRVAGTQLDPELVSVFCKVMSDEMATGLIKEAPAISDVLSNNPNIVTNVS
jgi:HD-GYP domain-containing protein (c-di-GMP phosphodiesterase class II)